MCQSGLDPDYLVIVLIAVNRAIQAKLDSRHATVQIQTCPEERVNNDSLRQHIAINDSHQILGVNPSACAKGTFGRLL
jgi:hypothetical protein